jgi:phosphoribosylformylglycinamidine synthase
VPASSLDTDAPLYERPIAEPADRSSRRADTANALPAPKDPGADLLDLLVDPSWVFSQYDHQLFLNTVEGPGGDATVLRLKHPASGRDTGRGLGLTVDGNHRWCALDPRRGTALVVAEAAMNLACVGARPLGVVNCLNFGNPEHPEVMWELSESIDGMAEACRALGIPVVGGNVSLYNESRGTDIDPTPVVGMLGLIDALQGPPPGVGLVDGGVVLVLGPDARSLSGSRWAWERHGHTAGEAPALDLAEHSAVVGLVRDLVAAGLLAGIHDAADGLGVAVAEMVVRSGIGCSLQPSTADHAWMFAESASRAVACVLDQHLEEVLGLAASAGVGATQLGRAGGDRIRFDGLVDVGVAEARSAWKRHLADAMGAGATH